jgi:hypothetical protein
VLVVNIIAQSSRAAVVFCFALTIPLQGRTPGSTSIRILPNKVTSVVRVALPTLYLLQEISTAIYGSRPLRLSFPLTRISIVSIVRPSNIHSGSSQRPRELLYVALVYTSVPLGA